MVGLRVAKGVGVLFGGVTVVGAGTAVVGTAVVGGGAAVVGTTVVGITVVGGGTSVVGGTTVLDSVAEGEIMRVDVRVGSTSGSGVWVGVRVIVAA